MAKTPTTLIYFLLLLSIAETQLFGGKGKNTAPLGGADGGKNLASSSESGRDVGGNDNVMEMFQEMLMRRSAAAGGDAGSDDAHMLLQQLAAGIHSGGGMHPASGALEDENEFEQDVPQKSHSDPSAKLNSKNTRGKLPKGDQDRDLGTRPSAKPRVDPTAAIAGAGGTGGIMDLLQGMMRGRRPEEDQEDAHPGGSGAGTCDASGTCSTGGEDASRRRSGVNGGRSARGAAGALAGGGGAAVGLKKLGGGEEEEVVGEELVKVDELCKKEFGRNSVFDGVDACRCRAGHSVRQGTCQATPAAPPPGKRGPARGTASTTAGKGKGKGSFEEQYNALCREKFGELAEFDGEDSCRCTDGSELISGQCRQSAAASAAVRKPTTAAGGVKSTGRTEEEQHYDSLCRMQHGPHARFDGNDSCECEDGYIEADGRCVMPTPAASSRGVAASAGAGEESLKISEAAFKAAVLGGKTLVVMFYAPWCGHCKAAKPAFVLAAARSPVPFYLLDCDQYKAVAKAEGIEGLPTIRAYAAGSALGEHDGERTTEAFVDFAQQVVAAVASLAPPPHKAAATVPARGKAGAGGKSSKSLEFDALCRQQFGEFSEFDGEDSCRCLEGYTEVNNRCIPVRPPAAAAAAPRARPPPAAAPASASRGGGGASRATPDFDALCRQQFGEFAEFDGKDSCRCQDGYQEVNGACVPSTSSGARRAPSSSPAAAAVARAGRGAGQAPPAAVSDKERNDVLCRQQFGDGAEFDGEDSCRCRAGYYQAGTRCIKG